MNILRQSVPSLELENQLNLLDVLFDHMPIGIAVLDNNFVLHRCNPTWADFASRNSPLSTNQIVPGVRLFDILPGTEPHFAPLFERVLAGETVRQKAFSPQENGTSSFYWDVMFTPITREGQTEQIVSFITDATERVRAQQELDDRIETHTREMATLTEIAHSLVTLEWEPLLDLILKQLKVVIDYSGAIIATLEDDKFTGVASHGPVAKEEVVGWQVSLEDIGQTRQMFNRREPIIIPDIWDDTLAARTFRQIVGERMDTAFGYARSWMGVPLLVKDRAIGMLNILHSQPNYYAQHHARLVLTFADYVAVAMENNRLYQHSYNLSILEERERLAGELHDNVAQAVGYLNLQISATNALLSSGEVEQAQANLGELKKVAGEVYTDLREEIFNLRATTSSGLGFLGTLRDYITKYRKYYDLNIQLAIETDEALLEFPMDMGIQVIRIIQEALINVRKHSGVSEAIIRFREIEEQIRISVEDKGHGFDMEDMDRTGESGFGLNIMRERAESAGGQLELDSTPGGGVRVIIWMPNLQKE